MFTDINLTDMESCCKVFKREIIQRADLKENRFEFEPEIVAKIARMKVRIFEMGISYSGRTYSEGKKSASGTAYGRCIVFSNIMPPTQSSPCDL